MQENVANGTNVGTVTKRKSHGSDTLSYAISTGNESGTFSIDPATGLIRVADNAQLDFEKLSTRWDDPATIQLFVTITDAADSTLNETVRVVVTVLNVNERPTISGGSASMFTRTQTGTELLTVNGSDQDRFDFPLFSIISGNDDGNFAIDATTGTITVVKDIANPATYTLTVRASDQGTPKLTADATVTVNVQAVPSGYTPGSVVQTFFESINGDAVTNLTTNSKFPNNPDSERFLTSFDASSHGVENYGSTVRGYIIPPATGRVHILDCVG